MANPFERALYDAATLTFRELASMSVTQAQRRRWKKEPEVSVQVSFSGPYCGTLYLSISDSILPKLAANMLGEDTPPAEELQCDALGEFANVICGNLLPKIGGTQAVYDVGVPLLVNMNTYLVFDPAAEVEIGLDGGRAELCLSLVDK
jgi:CheY-specific phosphatase CheX